MATFAKFCWFVTSLFCVLATFRLVGLWLTSSASAPQYAAEAAGICAMTIVPYVFSSCMQGLAQRDAADK